MSAGSPQSPPDVPAPAAGDGGAGEPRDATAHQVSVGEELPRWVIESVDAEKMKTMAALLADPNTIHWDVDDVRRLGLGDQPVNQGPTNMGYVVDMLAAWAGSPAGVRRLKVRFLGNVFAGDRLIAGGTVTAVRPAPGAPDAPDAGPTPARRQAQARPDGPTGQTGQTGHIVDCDVWLARDGTEAVLAGTAEVFLAD